MALSSYKIKNPSSIETRRVYVYVMHVIPILLPSSRTNDAGKRQGQTSCVLSIVVVKDQGRPSDPTHLGKVPSCALYLLAFPAHGTVFPDSLNPISQGLLVS